MTCSRTGGSRTSLENVGTTHPASRLSGRTGTRLPVEFLRNIEVGDGRDFRREVDDEALGDGDLSYGRRIKISFSPLARKRMKF